MMRSSSCRSSIVALGSLVAALVVPALASAQGAVHAGVPLATVIPAGATVLGVRAPDAVDGMVRVRLSVDGAHPAALLDLHVAASAADAQARYELLAEGISSRALVARDGIGDRALSEVATGPAGIVVAVRDNVVLAVRSIDDQLDAVGVAQHVDRAIRDAARGTETHAVAGPQSIDRGEAGIELVRGALLDLIARPIDDAHPRVTDAGVRVPCGHEADVVFVDGLLRVGVLHVAPRCGP